MKIKQKIIEINEKILQFVKKHPKFFKFLENIIDVGDVIFRFVLWIMAGIIMIMINLAVAQVLQDEGVVMSQRGIFILSSLNALVLISGACFVYKPIFKACFK